jgi:OFA family oxalate/formate antiporter-like MFS transporter
MTSERLPNRWGIAVAAVCIQLCLGAAYGWSVFKNPLMKLGSWSETSVQLNFTLIFIFFGFGTIIGGLWQDRVGPRIVATTAGVLYGVGYIVAGLATASHSLTGIYFGYGLLAGFGMGMGYICPIATLVKWFPDKRGIMTGVAVCGFGFAALLVSPFAAWEIINYGPPATFETLGALFLVVVVISAQFFSIPPHRWRPEGWEPRSAVAKSAGLHDFTVSEAMKTWQFYVLFLMLFMAIAAGFALISQASPMAQEMVGMPVLRAAATVGLIAIFNGIGRVFWPSVSDFIGRARVYFIIFLVEVSAFFLLPRLHDWTMFSVLFAVIGFCYGGSLGTMPSLVADYYGSKSVGGIYGAILFGANIAGTLAPFMIARVHQDLGSYAPAIQVITIAFLCSLLLPLIARQPSSRHAVAAPVVVVESD